MIKNEEIYAMIDNAYWNNMLVGGMKLFHALMKFNEKIYNFEAQLKEYELEGKINLMFLHMNSEYFKREIFPKYVDIQKFIHTSNTLIETIGGDINNKKNPDEIDDFVYELDLNGYNKNDVAKFIVDFLPSFKNINRISKDINDVLSKLKYMIKKSDKTTKKIKSQVDKV